MVGHRSTVPKAFGMFAVLFCLAAASVCAPASPVPDWIVRPGTIRHALAQHDGTRVYLDAVVVDKIKTNQRPTYITIHECFEYGLRLIALTAPDARLRMGQTIDVSGVMATLETGDRVVADCSIYGYLDERGTLLYHGPLIKGLDEPTDWEWKIDMTGAAGEPPPEVAQPTTDPRPGPTYYSTISDAVNRPRICTDGDFIALVELQCRPIVSTGTDQTYGDYFIMGEDTSQDTLKVYCQDSVTTDLRVNTVSGQLREESSTAVLCVNSGPGYDPQVYEGSLATAAPGSVAFAKTIANGNTATIAGKIVSADQTDFPGALYVQEPGRNAGIRVLYTGATQIDRGDSVNVIGALGIGDDNERQIDAGTNGVSGVAQPGAPKPLGFASAALGGDQFNSYTPGVDWPEYTGCGLYNKGLLVKTWGRVTCVDPANKCFYIDDGKYLDNDPGPRGVKVSWDWPTSGKPTITPPQEGWFVSVAGISGSEALIIGQEEKTVRLLRPRGQSDLFVSDPDDSTDPAIDITAPGGDELHKASGESTIRVAGVARDTQTCVVGVELGIVSGLNQSAPSQWAAGTYDIGTQSWYYDWTGATAGDYTIWARATDFAGNTNAVSRSVTLTDVGVIRVKLDGDDNNSGLTWALSKKTVQGGVAAAKSRTPHYEVWVAAGDYQCGDLIEYWPDGVAVYGGFTGSETAREQRNWRVNETIVRQGIHMSGDPGYSSSVPAVIDGFTLHGNIECNLTYVGYDIAIRHNTILGDLLISGGIAHEVRVESNWFRENGRYAGGIDCQGSGSAVRITNNTITDFAEHPGIKLRDGAAPTIANNILAYNNCAIRRDSGTGVPDILKNCFYGNLNDNNYDPIGLAPSPDTNIYADPQFLSTETPRTDIHILPASPHPCLNVGNSSTALVPEHSLDIDGRPRVVGADVDIGADELAEGDLETIEFPTGVVVAAGTSTTIAAHVYDQATDTDLAGRNVTFALSAGQITAINGRSASGTSVWGTTDSNGEVDLTITTPTPGQKFTVTATTAVSMGLVTRKCEVCPKQYNVGFLYDIALPGEEVNERMEACFGRITARFADVAYQRVTADQLPTSPTNPTPSTTLQSLNVVFLALPTEALTSTQVAALSSFIQLGRQRRVVLVGDFSASYYAYNTTLNAVAQGLGMYTRFYVLDEYENGRYWDCNVDYCRRTTMTSHYLAQGVAGLWEDCTDAFADGWQSHTECCPVAYSHSAPTLPNVMAEDTQTAGSRVAMHDSSMFDQMFNDDYDTVPDANFRFIYNLCTAFQPE